MKITVEYLASEGLSPTFVERFWSKVLIGAENNGCWEWTGSATKLGSGRIGRWREGQSPMVASVASWILNRGPVPKGFCVCHHCDNPTCVRPDHLFIGTRKDNTQDMMRKGRWKINNPAKGERNGNHKLTEAAVLEIRSLYKTGMLQREIGNKFGICQAHVSQVLLRNIWKHV